MHIQAPLSCPLCARRHDRPVRCVECGSTLVDAHGRAVPTTPATVSEAENNLIGLLFLGAAAAPFAIAVATGLGGLTALGLPTVMTAAAIVSAWQARGRERRDPQTRAALAAGRQPIAIREAIERGGGEAVAVRGELLHVPARREAMAGLPPRFAVTDGTGAALVDDDSLLLWGHDADGKPAWRTDELPLHRTVLVVGRARVASASEGQLVWHGAGGGYRDVSTVLAFDGDAAHRTVAFFQRPDTPPSPASVR